jgi:hypothetical protein
MENELNTLITETEALNEELIQTEESYQETREVYKEWKRKPFEEIKREIQSFKNAIVLISNHNRLLRDKIDKQVNI